MDLDTVQAVVDNLGDHLLDLIPPVAEESSSDVRSPASPQVHSKPSKHGLTHSHSNLSIGRTFLPGQPKLSLSTFTAATDQILENFRTGGSSHSTVEEIKQLDCAIYHDTLVVKAIQKVLNDDEEIQARIASLITVAFDSKLLTRPQITRAFEKLTQIAFTLDHGIDGIEDKLFHFFAAAVDDDVVNENFLARLPETLLRSLSRNILDNEPYLARNLSLLHAYKARCHSFMTEFFNCGDSAIIRNFFQETGDALFKDLDQENVDLNNQTTDFLIKPVTRDVFRHEFVRCLLSASLTQPNLQKEMVSRSLSELYGSSPDSLSADDIQLGVLRLLANVEELNIDCPNSSEIVSSFIVRMIVDDILPPAFVSDFLRLHLGDKLGVETLRRSFKWITEASRHHDLAERFQKVWTGTDNLRPEVEEFKRNLREIIFRYLNSGDLNACVLAINGLELSPDQGVEVARKIIVFALERQESEWTLAFNLLIALLEAGELPQEIIEKGFEQIKAKIHDIELDNPLARTTLENFFVFEAKKAGIVPEQFTIIPSEDD